MSESAGAPATRPFTIEILRWELEALRARIAATRWPERETSQISRTACSSRQPPCGVHRDVYQPVHRRPRKDRRRWSQVAPPHESAICD